MKSLAHVGEEVLRGTLIKVKANLVGHELIVLWRDVEKVGGKGDKGGDCDVYAVVMVVMDVS